MLLLSPALFSGVVLQLNRSGETVFLSICPKYAPQVELFLQPIQKQPLSQAVLETLVPEVRFYTRADGLVERIDLTVPRAVH